MIKIMALKFHSNQEPKVGNLWSLRTSCFTYKRGLNWFIFMI